MKITIISDVHIGDYPNYETYRYERLEWYRKYAEEVVEASKRVGSDLLFIAGDLSDRSTNPPEVNNVIRDVANIFNDYFKRIYYINGQHDLKVGNYDQIDNDKQSLIRSFASNKWIYGDHQIFEFGDIFGGTSRRIAMMNFNPEPDLSWITTPVDLFIGHVTINTSGFGSELDYSKFKLGIAGDIHYPCHKNNLYSVGVGVPRYLGDNGVGTFVICDLDKLSFERIVVDKDHHWLTRYVTTEDYDQEGPSNDKLDNGISAKYYYIYRPSILETQESKEMLFDSTITDVNEMIDKVIKDNSLSKVHGEVISQTTIQSVDLNFRLISLYIHNIRSIADHTLVLKDKQGLLQIISENGGGKSTIIWSLMYALKGGLEIRDEVREGEDEASVYLTLEYQGKTYGIYRGTDGVSLDIDGKNIDLGGKRDTEAGIYYHLPFINYIDSYFFTDDYSRILGSYSADRRLELISTYFRLDIISSYADVANNLLNERYSKGNQMYSNLEELNSTKRYREKTLNSKKSKLENYPSKEVLEKELLDLKSEYDAKIIEESKYKNFDLRGATTKALQSKKSCNDLLKSNVKLKEINDNIQKTLITAPEGKLWDQSVKIELEKEIATLNKSITISNYELTKLKKELDDFDKLKVINCPNCNESITLSTFSTVITKERLETRIEELKDAISSTNSVLKSKEESLSVINTDETNFKKRKSLEKELSDNISSISTNEKLLEIITKELNALTEKIDEYKSIDQTRSSKVIQESIDQKQRMISDWITYENLVEEYNDDLDTRISTAENEYTDFCNDTKQYEEYCNLMSINGVVYRTLLNNIVSRFSSSTFKYEVIEQVYRGKSFNNIVGYYKSYKMTDFREYSHCSNGQKTLMDLDFIKNLVTSAGVIVFDDFLGYLTTDNLIEGLRIIRSMKPTLKIITSQNDNSMYVDHSIFLKYNGSTTEFP